jgi:DNA-binding CsgD family transcriptional regulator
MKHDLWLTLTDADRALLRELAAGKSMKQAAHALRISIRAVHFRWQACRDRLACETPAHAIALLAGDAVWSTAESAVEDTEVDPRRASLSP